jgi:hypothetical protein
LDLVARCPICLYKLTDEGYCLRGPTWCPNHWFDVVENPVWMSDNEVSAKWAEIRERQQA